MLSLQTQLGRDTFTPSLMCVKVIMNKLYAIVDRKEQHDLYSMEPIPNSLK